MQDEYPTADAIHLHGLTLGSEDAFRLNMAAMDRSADALDAATTFADYEIATTFLRASLVDAIEFFGWSLPALVTYTSLDPEVILDLLDSTPHGAL